MQEMLNWRFDPRAEETLFREDPMQAARCTLRSREGGDLLITMGCRDDCPYIPAFVVTTGHCPIPRARD
jgi:hypothetical protein